MIEIKQLNKTYPSQTGPVPALIDINLTRKTRRNFWRYWQKRRGQKFFDPQREFIGTAHQWCGAHRW